MEKNLTNTEAIEKFLHLVNEIRICMFITDTKENDHTRPMATVSTDQDGTLWFFTDIRSIKVEEIDQENSVHLVYADPGKSKFLDVWGNARIITDNTTVTDKWSPIMKAWFPQGPADPNIALLKVSPTDVYYWDSESARMVSFLKIAMKAFVDKDINEGVEGNLKLH